MRLRKLLCVRFGVNAIKTIVLLYGFIAKTQPCKRSLSYTRLRELFLSKLSELGFDPKQFGLHSLRSGGASAAANAGVPDRLFKHHGRWHSESAKDGYVKDSMTALMSVSESLNL